MSEVKDKFDLYLDEMLVKLKECQESHSSNSCWECEKLLECELRDEYVKSAFDSMGKQQTGGFDF